MSKKENMIFCKKENKECFITGGEVHESNDEELNWLKENINYPIIIYFIDYELKTIDKILRKITDEEVEVVPKIINKKEYAFQLTKKEKEKVNVYKIKDKELLNVVDMNPYLLTNINNKKVLLEIERKKAINENGDYYYLLPEDLEEQENKVESINVEYVYTYQRRLTKKNN